MATPFARRLSPRFWPEGSAPNLRWDPATAPLRRGGTPGGRFESAGQSLVELAVLLPVLMLIVLGIADFGRAFNAQITITGAAYAGALYGSTSSSAAMDSAGIIRAALADAATLPGGPPTVVTGISTDPSGNQRLSVTLSYTFRTLFPYPGLPDSIVMARSAVMRVMP